MMEEDLGKLKDVVKKKKQSKKGNEQEIIQGRKTVQFLERDVEELTDCREKLKEEINNEKDLQNSMWELVVTIKKNINEVRKEKEKLQIAVKSTQKTLESL